MSVIVFIVFFSASSLIAENSADTSSRINTLHNLEIKLLTEHPDVIAQRLDERISASDIISAGLHLNPQLNLTADIFPVPGEKFNPQDKSYGVSIQVPFELGGKRGYRVEKAKLTNRSVSFQAQEGIRQALLLLRLAYWDSLSDYEILRLAKENLKLYKQLVELNKVRFEAKAISAAFNISVIRQYILLY